MRSRWVYSARWLVGMAAAFLALALFPRKAGGQGSPYTPYQHRAWYIYQIAQFTEWPKEAFRDDTGPFVLGILGDDPFGKDLDVIRSRPLKNRRIEVRHFKHVREAECHVLFISASEQQRLEEILKALDGAAILTVGEMPDFIHHSGMVKFWVERKSRTEGYLRFEINQAAAEKARLRINSHVLNLARPEKGQD